jgi:fibrillarin-like pre-rRNA processing protein
MPAHADVKKHEKFEGVYWVLLEDRSKRLGTKNLAPTISVYGETLVTVGEDEYRTWDAYRSKLAAAILRRLDSLPIRHGTSVLYLGSASGTTASHVSDIVEDEGRVYCVEFAQRSMRELIDTLCEHRHNVYPILADARMPEKYKATVDQVDVIYSDVAQPEQAKILADNADLFLKENGAALMVIKSRSVDVTMEPTDVFKQEIEILRRRHFRTIQAVRLEPYEKDHALVHLTWE